MLLKRRKTYYCRVWVPVELRQLVGRRELKKSLKTSDRKEARTAASLLVHKAETAFLRLRMDMVTERELAQITAELVAEFAGKVHGTRNERGTFWDFMAMGAPPQVNLNYGDDISILGTTFAPVRSKQNLQAIMDSYAARIEQLEDERGTGQLCMDTRRLVQQIVTDKGLDVTAPLPEWFNPNEDAWFAAPPTDFAKVADAVVTGLIEGYQAEMVRIRGRRDSAIEAAVAARVEAAKPKKRLSDLWASYQQDRMSIKKWGKATLKKYNGFYGAFIDIAGDCELVSFEDEGAVARFITNLQKYPKGKNQITSEYRGKRFDPSWADKTGFSGLEPAQINDMLIQLGAWFDYSLENPKAWGTSFNPFKNKRLVVEENDAKPKSAYTKEEIGKLIVGLMAQRPLVEPERFWIPLLGLFTGARSNELCQLRVDDIEVIDSISVIRIRHVPELMQFTKGRRSRIVPIHPTLSRLGFDDFVSKQIKCGHERLFPNLKLFEEKWNKRFGQWYNEAFEPRYISDEADKSFHSTRHSFISWFKGNLEMSLHNLSVVKSMVGHLDKIDKSLLGVDLEKDMTWGSKNYRDKHSPKIQLDLLKKLDYGVDFMPLKSKLK